MKTARENLDAIEEKITRGRNTPSELVQLLLQRQAWQARLYMETGEMAA